MAVNKKIVLHLLSKLSGFNEWQRCAVLEVVNRFEPDDETIFPILVCWLVLVVF